MKNYNSNFAIYIISSDKTNDICRHFVAAFKKKVESNYKIFIGTNTKLNNSKSLKAIPLSAKKSNWKYETLEQIKLIKKKYPKIKKLLIFLDDFIITDFIGRNNLDYFVKKSFENKLYYLSFRKIKVSFLKEIYFKLITKDKILKIPKDYPYYSSLQLAIWDINHFKKYLIKTKSIWDFETQETNKKHFFILNSPIKYLHVVEKGRWLFYAKKVCEKNCGFFKAGRRKSIKEISFRIKMIFTKILISIFGQLFIMKKRK